VLKLFIRPPSSRPVIPRWRARGRNLVAAGDSVQFSATDFGSLPMSGPWRPFPGRIPDQRKLERRIANRTATTGMQSLQHAIDLVRQGTAHRWSMDSGIVGGGGTSEDLSPTQDAWPVGNSYTSGDGKEYPLGRGIPPRLTRRTQIKRDDPQPMKYLLIARPKPQSEGNHSFSG
jgi:hypothetical protein